MCWMKGAGLNWSRILKQKLLSAFISKQDTAVPVKQFGLFGEGLRSTKEVMQNLSVFLSLFGCHGYSTELYKALRFALQSNIKQGRTHNLIFWMQTAQGTFIGPLANMKTQKCLKMDLSESCPDRNTMWRLKNADLLGVPGIKQVQLCNVCVCVFNLLHSSLQP